MAENNNINYDNLQRSDDKISASCIRSGLAELEMQTTQTLKKLQNVHINGALDMNNENKSMLSYNSLPVTSTSPSNILKSLEDLIAASDSDSASGMTYQLPELDEVAMLALVSQSFEAYISHLDRSTLVKIADLVAGDTSRWIGNLFKFSDPSASFHTDNGDAILRVLRLAIVSRCPGYLEGGIPALANPCLYISENLTPIRLQYACKQLGIAAEAIRVIPITTSGTMDLSLLQKEIRTDINANRNPLLVVADVGSSLCGFVDSLTRLKEICRGNNIWLHACGHLLASLCVVQGTGTISSVVDSVVLNLGSWLGIPSVPIILLHKPLQNNSLTVFDSDPILSRRLKSLSLWTSLQALGRENISEKIHVAFQTCSILYEITIKCEGLRLLSRAPGSQNELSLSDLINKPLDVDLLFESTVPVVVFQFDGQFDENNSNGVSSSIGDQQQDINQVIINKSIEKVANSSYFDRLNAWLGQSVQRDCPNFDFEIVEHQLHGTCIRYCPLELSLGEQPAKADDLENFAACLESHVDILRATIKHKATFIKLVEKSDVLRIVNLPEWAGMGGVRFVPEGWETLLTDQAKAELNKLNMDLVDALKSTDNAFSLGEGSDSLSCVRFGMVTHETDVEELLDLVVTVGKSVQENSKVLDSMSEIVKKGIETAMQDLQRESDEKLWQEGILRHVPVVGRVVNWWSPPAKESGIKGRSLNLTQGVVESTENIYKYHMQMSGAPNQLPGNKSPPTPMVQTTVVTDSAGHSRNVSQSSATSVQEIQIPTQEN